jgi:arylsulfatase A-like enzyme
MDRVERCHRHAPRGALRASLAAALLAAITNGCGPDCTPATGDAAAPIVLLVTVDTLRADHLGSDGNPHVRTPNLDRLASEGLRFSRAYAAANATLPSHASLFTSQPVARHGIASNESTTGTPAETVQARFRAAGYRTAAFVSAYHVGPRMTFGQLLEGLERFDAPRRVSKPRAAADTIDAAASWLRGACKSRAFAWIHLWDPHMPYAPPPPFDRAYYSGDPTAPEHRSLVDVEFSWALHDTTRLRDHLRRHPRVMRDLKRTLGVNGHVSRRLARDPTAIRELAPSDAVFRTLYAELRPVLSELHRTVPFNMAVAGMLVGVRDLAYPRAQYAGEVSYVDQEIGRLRAMLERWGIADRVVMVVTGDHGEGLGEHSVYCNHFGLFEEIVRVPLIVWAPGRVGAAVRDDPVSGLDVAPTLLRLTGLDVPPTMQGHDVSQRPRPDPVVSEAILGRQVALRDGDWKIVRTLRDYYVTTAFFHEAGDVELYDLAHDPREARNLVTLEPERLAAMSIALDAWLRANGLDRTAPPRRSPPAAPDRERDERLRTLGYVE